MAEFVFQYRQQQQPHHPWDTNNGDNNDDESALVAVPYSKLYCELQELWKFVPVLQPKNKEEGKYETNENGANDRAAAAAASSSTSISINPANNNAEATAAAALAAARTTTTTTTTKTIWVPLMGNWQQRKGYLHKFIQWNVLSSFFGARNGDDDGGDGVMEHTTPLEV